MLSAVGPEWAVQSLALLSGYKLTQRTTCEYELAGLLLAAELVRRIPSALEPFHIFLDNQTTIEVPTSVTLRKSQHLAQTIFLALNKPQRPGDEGPRNPLTLDSRARRSDW